MEEEKCQCGCVPEKNEFVTLEEKLLKTEVIRNLSDSVDRLAGVANEPNNPLLKQTINMTLDKIREVLGDM